MNIKEKFVLCTGCRKYSTINFTDKDTEKQIKCTICGQISNYNLNIYVLRKISNPIRKQSQNNLQF